MESKLFLGTDIVEVKRIKQLMKKSGDRFFKKVYTINEIEWCMKKENPEIHFAGKFAAKESVKKALLHAGETQTLPFNKIEINRTNDNPPVVRLLKRFTRKIETQVSISHTGDVAIAIAMVRVP